MKTTILWVILGYLSGSVLYARVFGNLFHCSDKFEECKDKNPGTSNAYSVGGFWCGTFTLLGDLLKGFFPVFLYVRYVMQTGTPAISFSFVLAAPVIGHILPLFYRFRGGKGIATTFGCLLGAYFEWEAVIVFACFFIIFSVLFRITPHYYRTLVTYLVTAIVLCITKRNLSVCLGFILITVITVLRFHASNEEREKMKVNLLWMH